MKIGSAPKVVRDISNSNFKRTQYTFAAVVAVKQIV